MAKPDYSAQKITVALIRKVAGWPPPERPREVLDSKRGLVLRHQPSGYLSVYALLGRGKRERLCNAREVLDVNNPLTFGQVLSRAKVIQGKGAGGYDFKSQRDSQRGIPTFKAYLDNVYGEWVVTRRKSGESLLARLRACFEQPLGNLKLTDITPVRVDKWRSRRQRAGIMDETINRDINSLRAALSHAVELELILTNPLQGFKLLKVDRKKKAQRALTSAEDSALRTALEERDQRLRDRRASGNEHRASRGQTARPNLHGVFPDVLTPAVLVSLETGLRKNELLTLEWDAVNFKTRELHIEGADTKSFETRDVPLNEEAVQVLRSWWMQHGQPKTGYVFSHSNGANLSNLRKSFGAVLEAAGIEKSTVEGKAVWHSLRHSFGSRLGAAGIDVTTIGELMGHANIETTQRYLHTEEIRKRNAVEQLAVKESTL